MKPKSASHRLALGERSPSWQISSLLSVEKKHWAMALSMNHPGLLLAGMVAIPERVDDQLGAHVLSQLPAE
jgi:hypothetical protein